MTKETRTPGVAVIRQYSIGGKATAMIMSPDKPCTVETSRFENGKRISMSHDVDPNGMPSLKGMRIPIRIEIAENRVGRNVTLEVSVAWTLEDGTEVKQPINKPVSFESLTGNPEDKAWINIKNLRPVEEAWLPNGRPFIHLGWVNKALPVAGTDYESADQVPF